jgi:DNA-binding NtrC family response regulator
MSEVKPTAPAVLVVQADDDVRGLLARILTGAGFPVRLAADGAEAVAAYRDHGAEIGLVLLDVFLPRLEGPATLAQLWQMDPWVRCCFVGARAGWPVPEGLLAWRVADSAEEPVTAAELVELVRRLARPAATSESPSCPA